MELEVEETPAVTVIKPLTRRIDANNSQSFKEVMLDVLETRSNILLDMTEIDFMDSFGCGVILSCIKNLSAKDGELKVFGLHKSVATLFEMVRLSKIMDALETRADGLASFSHR